MCILLAFNALMVYEALSTLAYRIKNKLAKRMETIQGTIFSPTKAQQVP